MSKRNKILLAISIFCWLIACRHVTENITPKAPREDELLDGPVEGLSTSENQRFLAGDFAFNDEVFFAGNGLGPHFVATSCGSCHAGDGKGHPFSTLTRFGQSDTTGNLFLNYGGPQLQNRALPGYAPEVIPAGASFSKFTPPANTGLGFLEALSDQQILANADPNDNDGDGISGRPNYIVAPAYFIPRPIHIQSNGKYIGRYGKKAAAIDLLHQTVNAYNQDMGITSEYAPYEPAINGQGYPYFDNIADPEVSSATINNVVFYLKTLKAPIQRSKDNQEIQRGQQIFSNIKCNGCHIAQWTTQANEINALAHKTFYPYTDLLLHDMGPALDDGYTEGSALTSEWKTPALWGLGLSKNSQGGLYYLMHDGRASSIRQAIEMHGGEAQNSRNQYYSLSETEKEQLMKFLESL